jgi:hypothetical protein
MVVTETNENEYEIYEKEDAQRTAICYAPARVYGGRYAWFCQMDQGLTRQRLLRRTCAVN